MACLANTAFFVPSGCVSMLATAGASPASINAFQVHLVGHLLPQAFDGALGLPLAVTESKVVGCHSGVGSALATVHSRQARPR
jgi:hypothetical protein